MTASLSYKDNQYSIREGETVLDALLRQGVNLPFSCRNGVCHVCQMKITEGAVAAGAQKGVAPALKEKNYFLPCRCKGAMDFSTELTIADPEPTDCVIAAVVAEKEMLAADICRLRIEPFLNIEYIAGQFINLRRKQDGLTRSYSLASVPGSDYFLELHVKCYANGGMSRWIADELAVGDELEFIGPLGDCCYSDDDQGRDLALVCNGAGMSTMSAIARDALYKGHRGAIRLYHGVRRPEDLYLDDAMRALQAKHDNFHYIPCVSSSATPGCFHGRVTDAAVDALKNPANTALFMAGSAEMIAEYEQLALLHGVDATHIHKDLFVPASKASTSNQAKPTLDGSDVQSNWQSKEAGYPPPAPELWAALGEGDLLAKILDEFYDRVFDDPLLSPYFHKTTKQRAKDKVYSFYRRLFSGAKDYFGDRPRNAHHWMVISDKIFDYREALLKSMMRKHGLSEPMIARWLRLEEHYRGDIVKDKAWGRMVDGVETPAEGFGSVKLEVGSMCDGCGDELHIGTEVIYHLRTGETYCPGCRGRAAA